MAGRPGGTPWFHYLNRALVGSTNPETPAVLLYEPNRQGGDLRLVGIDLTTDGDRPSLFGRGFDGPMLGHSPEMPVHFDMHVWLYKNNPEGVFEPWNPRVGC